MLTLFNLISAAINISSIFKNTKKEILPLIYFM